MLLPELSISLWVGLNEESPPVGICNCTWPCICICVINVSGLASLLRGRSLIDYWLLKNHCCNIEVNKSTDHPKSIPATKSDKSWPSQNLCCNIQKLTIQGEVQRGGSCWDTPRQVPRTPGRTHPAFPEMWCLYCFFYFHPHYMMKLFCFRWKVRPRFHQTFYSSSKFRKGCSLKVLCQILKRSKELSNLEEVCHLPKLSILAK